MIIHQMFSALLSIIPWDFFSFSLNWNMIHANFHGLKRKKIIGKTDLAGDAFSFSHYSSLTGGLRIWGGGEGIAWFLRETKGDQSSLTEYKWDTIKENWERNKINHIVIKPKSSSPPPLKNQALKTQGLVRPRRSKKNCLSTNCFLIVLPWLQARRKFTCYSKWQGKRGDSRAENWAIHGVHLPVSKRMSIMRPSLSKNEKKEKSVTKNERFNKNKSDYQAIVSSPPIPVTDMRFIFLSSTSLQ